MGTDKYSAKGREPFSVTRLTRGSTRYNFMDMDGLEVIARFLYQQYGSHGMAAMLLQIPLKHTESVWRSIAEEIKRLEALEKSAAGRIP